MKFSPSLTQPILSFLLLGCTLEAQAALLTFKGQPSRTITAAGVTVPVHPQATTQINGKEHTLYLTGAGVYRRPVAFLKVPVLIATHYTDLQTPMNASQPMHSIQQAKVKAIQLTATMPLHASEIRDLIEQALDINGVDLNDVRIRDAVDKVRFSPNEGEFATMMGVDNLDSTQTVSIEFGTEQVQSTSKDIANLIWLVWFGNSLDSGIAKLKADLILGH